MRLEVIAEKYLSENAGFNEYYKVGITDNGLISTTDLISAILSDIIIGRNSDYISAKFHFSLIEVIRSIADADNYIKIAFSGGVFQNSLLVDLIINKLSEKYNLYFHKKLSPNDECIPYGQLMAYQQLKRNNVN